VTNGKQYCTPVGNTLVYLFLYYDNMTGMQAKGFDALGHAAEHTSPARLAAWAI
jgi:hypothetical protein